MDAQKYLAGYSKKADSFLKHYFGSKIRQAGRIDPGLADAVRTFYGFTQGGKKVRGALTILGFEAAGGRNLAQILPVSCGIELLHNFLLIEDDIVDKDTVRRGKSTVHTHYAKVHGEHYGLSKAMVVADYGVFFGYGLISEAKLPAKRKCQALSALSGYLVKTGHGELLDIDYDFKKRVTWPDIQKVRLLKSAHYTFSMPLAVGAILGGAGKKVLQAIEDYGSSVGIAFQLHDDELGVFGDPKITGKSNDIDIKSGKKTLLYFKALELAGKANRRFLENRYGHPRLSSQQIDKVRTIFEASGSLAFSQATAQKLVMAGKAAIPRITKNKAVQEILASMAEFVINRPK